MLASLTVLLVGSYTLIAFSDPARWYVFARDFGGAFGETRLAYAFPLFLAGAIAAVGPFYGFLVNIPVLCVLSALVYAMTRQQSAEARIGALSPAVAAAAASSFLVALNADLLLIMSSPYRDPLSHCFLIGSFLLVVRFRRQPRRVAAAAGSGACLALAASAREPAILALIPIAAFVLATRRDAPGEPFWRPAGIFVGALLLASLPLLVQNYLLSGNPIVPGQSLRWIERRDEFVPGIRAVHLLETLPSAVAFLAEHYGAASLLLVAGVYTAVRRRCSALLYLTLPAFLTFLLFYGAYARVVLRYFFVVDLFAAPVAGLGAAALVASGLRAVRSKGLRTALANAAFVAALAPAFALPGMFAYDGDRLEIQEARDLREKLLELLPAGARVVGERPMVEIISCFAGDQLEVDRDIPSIDEMRALLEAGELVYIVYRLRPVHMLELPFEVEPVYRASSGRRVDEVFEVARLRLLGDANPGETSPSAVPSSLH